MEKVYTAVVTAKGGRDGEIKSENGKLAGAMRKPVEMGGDGNGYNPEELFAGAWGPCYLGALAAVAKKHNQDVSSATCKVSVSFNKDGEGFGLSAKLEVSIPGMDKEKAQALANKAHAACPYSKAVKGNIPAEVVAV